MTPPKDTEEEFKALYTAHYRPIHHFFRTRGVPNEDCSDLTQETFMRAYHGFQDYRGEASHRCWLIAIAGNIWRNYIRDRKAEKRRPAEATLESISKDDGELQIPDESGFDSTGGGPLNTLLSDERVDALKTAISTLPQTMRHCVVLRSHLEMKYKEIARTLHIPMGRVRSQLHQAKQILKDKLSPYFDDFEF